MNTFDPPLSPIAAARRAYEASLYLANTRGVQRFKALQAMAKALKDHLDDILEANTLDLEASRDMAVPELIVEWLKLTPERLHQAIAILQRLAQLPDPMRRVMNASYQVEQSQTYCQLMPLGTIAFIYEAFPDLGAIAAGMSIKTGNSIILKGGGESSHSNRAIAEALEIAMEEADFPSASIQLLLTEEPNCLRELVTQDKHINLAIPYGRPGLVQQIVRYATVPVLRSAMGNCYLYWSDCGSLDLSHWAIADSHRSEPDPVNAIEKVLVHCQQSSSALRTLWRRLKDEGFELRGDATLVAEFPELQLAEDVEWGQAYLTKTVAFRWVDSLEQAIAWINGYSSGHADCIITDSYQESCQFAIGVQSASTFINASPCFSRNPQPGDAVFLGMSNQKGYRRGLIGLETLTTLKHVIQGSGYL